ncbi:MAG: DUF3316 domain-containing protein [Dysgonamonadaceae bacterium]|jgi:hypothetical protein|nr:DUF3316 domain-containing protein [Dysgonamonadaceae bacterium]
MLSTINKTLCIFLLFLPVAFLARSQEEKLVPLTYQSSLIGFGTSRVYDSYLSPLIYSGSNVGILYEKMCMAGWGNGNFSPQHQLFFDYSCTGNKTNTASDHTGLIEYDYTVYYRFNLNDDFQVFAGAQAGVLLGFIYNSRNGNNPVSAKGNVNLGLSGIAAYKLMIKSQPVRFRYQFNLPVAGGVYSPQFGESYYEIGLGNSEKLFYLSSFHNHFAFKNILSVELPLNWLTFRATFANSFYQTIINDLTTQWHSNTFYLGVSKNFYTVNGREQHNGKYSGVFK